jgi:hypothetical protein
MNEMVEKMEELEETIFWGSTREVIDSEVLQS